MTDQVQKPLVEHRASKAASFAQMLSKHPEATKDMLEKSKEQYIGLVNVLYEAAQKADMPLAEHKKCQGAAEAVGKLIANHFDLAAKQLEEMKKPDPEAEKTEEDNNLES